METKEIKKLIEESIYTDSVGKLRIPEQVVDRIVEASKGKTPDSVPAFKKYLHNAVWGFANQRRWKKKLPVFKSVCDKIEDGNSDLGSPAQLMEQITDIALQYVEATWLHYVKRKSEEIDRNGYPYCHECQVPLAKETTKCPECNTEELDLFCA